MTIKELYEWAVLNEVENCDIEIQNYEDNGNRAGTRTLHEQDIEIDNLHAAVIL